MDDEKTTISLRQLISLSLQPLTLQLGELKTTIDTLSKDIKTNNANLDKRVDKLESQLTTYKAIIGILGLITTPLAVTWLKNLIF